MANNTRSSHKNIDENKKSRQSTLVSASAESSGLQKSPMEEPVSPERFTSQPSDQIEKQTLTPPVTGFLGKKRTVCGPLRRSERCKKQPTFSDSQGSKADTSFGSPASHDMKRKNDRKRENSPRQSTSGTAEACKDEEDSPEIKKGRMPAHAYKALFQEQEKKVKVSGGAEELDGADKSFLKDGSNSGDRPPNEGAAAGEIGNITGDGSLPDQEAVEKICEEKPDKMKQKFDDNIQLLSSPKSVAIDRSDDPRRIEDISLSAELLEVKESCGNERSLDDNVHKKKFLDEQVDAVAIVVGKDNTSILSTSGHEENNVGEASGLNIGRKSGEPEAGNNFKSCENSAQPLGQSLEIQGNDFVVDPEQLSRCTSTESEEDCSRFVEYWVPVQMSHVQLEQYCSTLVNSLSLRSPSRTDHVGALRDILTATRKCCDHPYLVDSSLQSILTKDVQPVQFLDIGIQASGKLQLLDKFLVEMRSRGLRALILFQTIGSFGEKESITIGDILDDAVRQRFGEGSYERVDGGLLRSKIQTALSNFNNKELGRFVFLLEARACRPIIKLSSVDVVVIFGSDWSPSNDIRNLQRIMLESESEKIKVFRLYSCFTVEEKVLICSKKGVNIDGRVHDRTPSNCHLLLMWGATYLFNKLNEFHCSYSESSHLVLSDPEHAKDVIKELLSLLPIDEEENNLSSSSMILRVKNDGFYHTDFPLHGESKENLTAAQESLPPPKFWTKLLEEKHPQWKYSSGSSQRNRKRIPVNIYGNDADEGGKKRKKLMANNSGVQSPRKRGKGEGKIAGEKEISGSFHPPTLEQDLDSGTDGWDEARKLRDSQRSLYWSLQPEISRICEVLNLEDEVKNTADIFLNYVINNHRVTRDPATILQAFQLALCWTAASLLKVKVDRKESFQLVKTHLNYGCKKEEADHVYTLLRHLKEMFLDQRRSIGAADNRAPSSDLGDVEDLSLSPSKEDLSNPDKFSEQGILKGIKEIKKEYRKKMEKLMQQQKKEIDENYKAFEAEKATFDNKHGIETAIIRLHREGPVRKDMLNALESEHARKIEEHKNQMTERLNQLDRAHLTAKTKLYMKEASYIKHMREWAQTNLPNMSPELVDGENVQTGDDPNVVDSIDNVPDVNVCNLSGSGLGLLGIPEAPCNTAAAVSSACENNESSLEGLKVRELDDCTGVHRLDQDPENYISTDPCLGESIADGVTSSMASEEVPLDRLHTASYAQEKADQVNLLQQGGDISPEISPFPNREGVCSHSDTVNARSQNMQPLHDQIPDRPTHEATEILVADDVNSVFEQDISGTPNDQVSHPEELDSTPRQPLATSSQAASVSTLFPEEPHAQSNESCAPSRMQEENAFSVEQLNGPAQFSKAVSANCDATPDQPDSEAADAELTVQPPSVPDVPPVDGAAQHPSVEGHNSVNVQAMRQVHEPQINSVQGTSNNVTATGHGTRLPEHASTPNTPGSSIRSAQTPLLVTFGMGDPLQIEYGKIQRELDLTTKNHEEMKMQLKLDCEKEIEHAISQIRQKYNAKQQEAEADYTLKRKKLEANQNQVLMSKILAAAFGYKCMDFRASEARARSDAMSSVQQLMMLSQPSPASPSVVQGPSYPCVPPTPSSLHPSTALSSALTIPPQSMNPVQDLPAQQLLHHAPLRASSPRPPPVIGQFTAPSNRQVPRGIRAPAPHLQPFRPSPSPSPANLPPRGMALSPSTASHRPVPVVDAWSTQVPSIELLRAITHQQNPTQSNNLQQPQLSFSDMANLAEVRRLGMRENAVQNGTVDASQIVCLSDDDDE